MLRKARKIEYGDFQTPRALAEKVCSIVKCRQGDFATIVEPTCGLGGFLLAAARSFPDSHHVVGVEINPAYFEQLRNEVAGARLQQSVDLRLTDFFSFDWRELAASMPAPILVLGNPPWVTASQLGALESANLPTKSNFQNLRGLDAKTGKSNFDIAEWMVLRLLQDFRDCGATLAMLLKSSVMRRLLAHAWSSDLPLSKAEFYMFDAKKHFGVAVDAGLFVCDIASPDSERLCTVRSIGDPDRVLSRIVFRHGQLTADADGFDRTSQYGVTHGKVPSLFRWRSGIKHDCGRVLELQLTPRGLVNGFGDLVEIEDDVVFPLLKGSAVGSNRIEESTNRYLIVPQMRTGEDTSRLAESAPKAWAYLNRHCDAFEARKSSIYRHRPAFSIFGVGDYTFQPWKVAICGLYKQFSFGLAGPRDNRPTVFDDTVYHLSFSTEALAKLVLQLLQSDIAMDFYHSRVFWDSKRPITADLLQRCDLLKVAHALGREIELQSLLDGEVKWNKDASGVGMLF